MNFYLLIRPEAELDLLEAYRWYEDRSQGLGAEFLLAVDACLSSIQRSPLAYPLVYREIRRALIRKFPYGIFYLIEGETVAVVACFHSKRDPQQWQSRA